MTSRVSPPQSLSDVLSLHPLLGLAWRSAWAAGRFLRDERPAELAVDTKSSPTDAVTVMDRTAEAMIIGSLLAERPDDGVLGEEGGQRESRSGVRWIIDPLDGTVNYLYRLPLWGVSIAAEDEQGVVIGVIVTPEFDEAYVGVRGHGAWRVNGPDVTRLKASDETDLGAALVSTGFSYDVERRRRQAAVVASLIPHVRDVRRIGSAVIDLCWVASGRLSAHFEKGLNEWDYAAGALIATEAGALVAGLVDDDLSDMVVSAAPGISHQLRELLAQLGAGEV
jgi:myo-inositol-1(or 4)-monophosphatase